jgi:hypothetical protein
MIGHRMFFGGKLLSSSSSCSSVRTRPGAFRVPALADAWWHYDNSGAVPRLLDSDEQTS